MYESIEKLKDMRKKLVGFGDFPVLKEINTYKELKVNGDVIKLTGLMKTPECAISLVEVPGGLTMAKHLHEEVEVIGVITGSIIVHFENAVSQRMDVNGVITIPPFTPHTVEYLTDGTQWAITMPGNNDFPEGVFKNE